MTKRRSSEAPFRRPRVERTPAQLDREREIGTELMAIARVRFPHRFSPIGEPLIGFTGDSWPARLASWERSRS